MIVKIVFLEPEVYYMEELGTGLHLRVCMLCSTGRGANPNPFITKFLNS